MCKPTSQNNVDFDISILSEFNNLTFSNGISTSIIKNLCIWEKSFLSLLKYFGISKPERSEQKKSH